MTMMRWAWAAGTALGMMATSATAQRMPPVLTGAVTKAQAEQRCSDILARAGTLRQQLEAPGTAKGLAALQQYDAYVEVLRGGFGEFGFYQQVSTEAGARDVAQDCRVKLGNEFNALSLSRPIYEKIKAIPMPTDAPTKLYLSRTLQGFEASGIALDADKRAEARKLGDRISELNTAFTANIPKGQRTITVTPAELDGLPTDFIAAHKPGADGKITLRTDSADYVPVMTYAKDRSLRQRFQREYNLRAYPENDKVLRELIDTRDAFAKLVGRPDYATLDFEDRMLNTPAKVENLFTDLAAAIRPSAEADYAKKLAALRQIDPQVTKIEPWDNNFLNPIVQKQLYGFDRQEARRYFSYPKVRDGILQLSEELFGIDIRPWNIPLWYSEGGAGAYEVFENNKLIGRFFLDMHPRPGKYEHANVITVRPGAKNQVPIAALVMNTPSGLMEHSDVTTFLHEYGHLLHAIFAGQNQKWVAQSGIATEPDFGEAPSQMLENWVYDYDTLKRFATDETGKPIPQALVEQMNRARYFNLGMADMRGLGLSNAALRYYQGKAPADLGAAFRQYVGAYDLLPPAEGSQQQASFPHLAGYGAAYYTYTWSLVIADDMFTRFEKEGLRNPKTAADYRRLVLAPGGSKPAAELVSDFLGRPVSVDAYKANMEKGK